LLSVALVYIWAWLDDAKPSRGDIVTSYIAKLFNEKLRTPAPAYEEEFKRGGHFRCNEAGRYSEDTYTVDTSFMYLLASVILAFTPVILFTAFVFYEIVAVVITVVILARVARSTRRLQKKLNKHMDNKEAHK